MQENRGNMLGIIILMLVLLATIWRADSIGSFIYFGIAHLIFVPMAYFFYMLWQVVIMMLGDSMAQMFPMQQGFQDITSEDVPIPPACREVELQLEALGFGRLGEILVQVPLQSDTVMYYFVSDKKPVIAMVAEQNGLALVQFMSAFRNRARLFTYYPDGFNLVTPTLESRVVRHSVPMAWQFHQQQLERLKEKHGTAITYKDVQAIIRSMREGEFADIAATWDYRFKHSFRAAIVILLALILVVPAWWALYTAPEVEFKLLLQLGASVVAAFLLITYWQYQSRKDHIDIEDPREQ